MHVGVETDGSQVKRALSLPTSLLGELNLSKIQAAHNFSCCSSGRAVSVPLAWNYSFLGNYSRGKKNKNTQVNVLSLSTEENAKIQTPAVAVV